MPTSSFMHARGNLCSCVENDCCNQCIVTSSLNYSLNFQSLPYLTNEAPCTQLYPNMDFLCLNICGLNSKLKYRNFHNYIEQFSFVSLGEIRTSHISPDEFPGFQSIISERKCTINGTETKKINWSSYSH